MAKDAQVVLVLDPKAPNGVSPVDIDTFKGMPMQTYLAMIPSFTNTYAHNYYASVLYKAGQPILAGKNARLFDKGIGDPDKYVNQPASGVELTEYLTNMTTEGEFDNQTSFILEQISAEIELSTDSPAFVNGQIQAPATTVVANYSAVNHILAIRNQFKLVYNWGDQPIYEGRLKEFPDPFSMSGAIGASVGGFVQNGLGTPAWNKLASPEVLKSNDRFSVDIKPLADTFTPQVDFRIVISLLGRRIRSYR